MFILPVLLGCKSSQKPKTDLDKENLKGDVILVEEGESLTFYNDQGNLSKSLIKGDDFYDISTSDFVDGKITSKKSSSRFGGINTNELTTYSYNDEGVIISATYNGKPTKYVYDKGLLSSEISFSNSGKMVYKTNYFYNNSGIDSIVSYYFDDISYMTVQYFNKDGLIDSVVLFNGSDYGSRKFTGKNIFTYDGKGNKIILIEISLDENSDQVKTEKTTYEYSYDPKGNWIQRKSFVDGKEEEIVNRKVIYKGQDISEYEKKYNDFIVSIKSKGSNDNNGVINNSPSNTNESTRQPVQREKQWVNCRNCNGRGILICTSCTGRGSMKCDYCFGRGWKMYGTEKQTCNTCGGTGEKKCNSCYGKGNRGTCSTCGGRGQVQL